MLVLRTLESLRHAVGQLSEQKAWLSTLAHLNLQLFAARVHFDLCTAKLSRSWSVPKVDLSYGGT